MTNEPVGTALSPRLRDERGVIVSFVVKTLVIFAILGVVAFDAGQVVVDQIKAGDVAQTAAQAAADIYYSTKNEDRAKQAGITAAANSGGNRSKSVLPMISSSDLPRDWQNLRLAKVNRPY